jgi:hypothetical protein
MDKMSDIEKDAATSEHHEANATSQPHHRAPHADVELHHDAVAPEAVGGLYNEMPKGYYWSKDFIGTLIVSFRLLLHPF